MMLPNLSYSQFGEDIVARHALRQVSRGFYVDVGAHHPLKLSNTALMHFEGWDGINVEPRLDAIEEFEKYRPRALNLRAAIHNDLEFVTLHKFQGGRVDTVVPDRARGLSAKKKFIGEETVPAMSLNKLFDTYVPEVTHVNYLSVDIEGYDKEAILAFDLHRHRPDVICVELHKFDVHTLARLPIVRHLSEAGYHLYSISVLSITFVRKDAAGRLGLWQVPQDGAPAPS
jgi:FkbM family methyltransferase